MALELIDKHWNDDGDGHDAGETVRLLREFTVAAEHARESMRRELGVNATDLAALEYLLIESDTWGVTASVLGRHLGLSSASTTILVSRLERADHLRREPAPQDRRANLLFPTERARSLLRSIVEHQTEALAAVVRSFDQEDLEVVEEFLGASIAALRNPLPPRG
ncbi:MarR family winged helix-turn-helix transcriptional regulator [Arthrobacter sp. RAF14]|uniref:MarR family winged helix-turn-helix transcriptional regulator n=1 Tax=Arthrobacter sp. RAF14 TaxID=3233051 RepID=UPI003F93B4FB